MNFKNISPTDLTTTAVNLAMGYFVGILILVSSAFMLQTYANAWDNYQTYQSLDIVETGQYHIASLPYKDCVALETLDAVTSTDDADCDRIFQNVESWKDYRYPGPGIAESLFWTVIFGGLTAFVLFQILSVPWWVVAYYSKSAAVAYVAVLIVLIPLLLSFFLFVSAGWQNSNNAWKDTVSVRTAKVYITRDDTWYKAPNTLWEWGDSGTMQEISGPKRD